MKVYCVFVESSEEWVLRSINATEELAKKDASTIKYRETLVEEWEVEDDKEETK